MALRVQSRSGKVHVIAEQRDDIDAETDELEVFPDNRERPPVLVVRSARGGSKTLTVRCPVDTDVWAGTQSGSVRLEGSFGAVRVTTMSGEIEVDDTEEADLRSMSGSIKIRSCNGRCRANAVSGSISAGKMHEVWAQSVSGSVKVGHLAADLHARTVSGSIEVASDAAGDITVKTVSGGVKIAVPDGTRPRLRVKTRGRVACDCPPGDDMVIQAASLSGGVEVVPA
jgi:hypothetical protein